MNVGDKVRVTAGALDGKRGEFVRVDAGKDNDHIVRFWNGAEIGFQREELEPVELPEGMEIVPSVVTEPPAPPDGRHPEEVYAEAWMNSHGRHGYLDGGLPDSGSRREFATGSVRDAEGGKGRYDLIPFEAVQALAKRFEDGAVKYGDNNWKLGQPLHVFLDCAGRHLFKAIAGMKDEDHPAAVLWNMAAFIWTAARIQDGTLPAELDDIGWTATNG